MLEFLGALIFLFFNSLFFKHILIITIDSIIIITPEIEIPIINPIIFLLYEFILFSPLTLLSFSKVVLFISV